MVRGLAPKGRKRSLDPNLECNIETGLLEVTTRACAPNPYYRLQAYAAEAALCEVGRAGTQNL